MHRFFALLAVLLMACSSGGPGTANLGGGGGGGGGDPSALCTNLCAWNAKCDRGDGDCAAECPTTLARYQGKWSAAFINYASSCFATLSCTGSDDSCVANFAAVDPAYPNIPEVQQCMSRRTACAMAGGDSGVSVSWSDDKCLSITALTSSARAEAAACLAKSCEQISSCLTAAGTYSY